MSNTINYDEFIKKYGIAISGLSQRIAVTKGAKVTNEQLAQKLYQDAMSNKVDMKDMTMAVTNFYQGSVAGQIKMSNYVEKYK